MILFLFVMAKDYARPWLGFTTKAQGFDKWAHAAGSALILCLLYRIVRAVLERNYHTYGHSHKGKTFHFLSLGAAFGLVMLGGLGLEIYQGFANPWGFSFMDMVANILGALVAFGALNHANKRGRK